MRPYKIIISGGGTGGHIYPAIAIANQCKERWQDAEILFVGAQDRMEMQKVPAAGYAIKGLWISGLQRSMSLRNLSFPFKVLKSLWDARKIVKDFAPDIAIGTGGYASGPLLYVAHKAGVPTLIQEQNSYPGITNRLLGKKADMICVASKGLERFFPKEKLSLTGNPVRQDILDIKGKRAEAITHFGLQHDRKTLLVMGGSLGARRINQLMQIHHDALGEKVQILWQCGSGYYDTYKSLSNENTQVLKFIKRMDLAYAAADIIISRAGASAISELCIVGKPVLFIPSPHVAEDHQTKNAQALVDVNAAMMLREDQLESDFVDSINALITDETVQNKLSQHIGQLALPQATNNIVEHIAQLLHD